jgi:hypothetical protein
MGRWWKNPKFRNLKSQKKSKSRNHEIPKGEAAPRPAAETPPLRCGPLQCGNVFLRFEHLFLEFFWDLGFRDLEFPAFGLN